MALSRIRAQHTGTSVAMEEISMEEEALLIQESAGDLAEAEAEIEDAQELADTSDALEDLAMVADGIDEASENEVALVEAGVQLATAGSDLEVEDVAPGLESYIGRRISTEGIKETARAIYDAIVRAIKKFWEKIKAFFRKTIGTLANLRRSAEALRKKADDCHGKVAKDKQTELGSEANALSLNWKAPKTGKAVVDALSDMVAAAKGSLDGLNGKVAKIGENLADALGDFDGDTVDEADKSLRRVCAVFGNDYKASFQNAQTSYGTRFPAGDGVSYAVSNSLPGNHVLVSVVTKGADKNPLAYAATIRSCKIVLTKEGDKDKDPVSEATITTITPAEAEKISEQVIDLVGAISIYESGKGRKDADKAKERVEKVLSKVKERMEKIKTDDASVISRYRAALNLAPTFTRMMGGFQAQITSASLATSRAAIVAANKSLAKYH